MHVTQREIGVQLRDFVRFVAAVFVRARNVFHADAGALDGGRAVAVSRVLYDPHTSSFGRHRQ